MPAPASAPLVDMMETDLDPVPVPATAPAPLDPPHAPYARPDTFDKNFL
jgi:hypothetical protein